MLLLAQNPSTPAEVLSKLASKEQPRELRIAAAMNPSAPSDVLEELSRDDDAELRCAVAGNEAAPTEVLARLARGGTNEIRRAIASNQRTPLAVRVELWESQELRAAVRGTGFLEPAAARLAVAAMYGKDIEREILAHDPAEDVRRSVACSPHASSETLDLLARDPSPRVAAVAVARRSKDARSLAHLASTGDIMTLSALIINPATPLQLKRELAPRLLEQADTWTLVALARDPDSSPTVLQGLTQRAERPIRAALAGNPSTPAAALALLARDPDPKFRTRLATSASLPAEAAARLATDTCVDVRRQVAGNTSTPSGLLLRLASDEDYEVRLRIAKNPSTPADGLRSIFRKNCAASSALDKSSGPRTYLPWTADDAELERENLGRIRSAIGTNPSTPHDVLHKLVQIELEEAKNRAPKPRGYGIDYWVDPRDREREALLLSVAKNPSVSLETLRLLRAAAWVAERTDTESHSAPMDEGGTYYVSVYSPAKTQAAREETSNRIGTAISRLLWGAGMDSSTRLQLAGEISTAREVLAELATDDDAAIRQKVGGNSNTPPSELSQLMEDTVTAVRVAVAANPNTPADAFLRAVADRDVEVRLAAAGANHGLHELDFYLEEARPRIEPYRVAYEKLSRDTSSTVRTKLASNPEFWIVAQQHVRGQMAFDKEGDVRSALAQTFLGLATNSTRRQSALPENALLHLIDTGGPELWRALAWVPDLTDKVVSRLLKSEDSETVQSALWRAHTSQLVKLAATNDSAVLSEIADRDRMKSDSITRVLARNIATPPEILSEIARRTQDPQTLKAVLRNPSAPSGLLANFASGTSSEHLRAAMAVSSDPDILATIAANPASPGEVFSILADSVDQLVLTNLLINPNTPPEILARLIDKSSDQ